MLFTFIDLFSGIGGFRIALEDLGGVCLFSSDIDENARRTYQHVFSDVPAGDITLQETKDAVPPGVDILCAGFPCQSFSVAGEQKGFGDERGTLFFDVFAVLKAKQPRAFILENVKNLVSHDGGNTIKTIVASLELAGYIVRYKVLDALEYANIPQHRERVFIVGFRKDLWDRVIEFEFPEPIPLTKRFQDLIAYGSEDKKLFYSEKNFRHYDTLIGTVTDPDRVYQYRRHYMRENKSGVCPTLTANMGTGGHNVPIIIDNGRIRKLSPRECLNFQGFPDWFEFPEKMPYNARYKQSGNTVVVPLVRRVAERVIEILQP